MKRVLHHFKASLNQAWYGPLLALLAAVDYFIVVIPTDGLLISSSIAAPRRWFQFALWLAIGSVLGGVAFSFLVSLYGNGFLIWIFPTIRENQYWILSDKWMNLYGSWAVFFVTALPILSHPILAIAALMKVSIRDITVALLCGRIIKYGVFSWLASHAPQYLFRLKSLRKEADEATTDYLDS